MLINSAPPSRQIRLSMPRSKGVHTARSTSASSPQLGRAPIIHSGPCVRLDALYFGRADFSGGDLVGSRERFFPFLAKDEQTSDIV
jgi:hypothetical protein